MYLLRFQAALSQSLRTCSRCQLSQTHRWYSAGVAANKDAYLSYGSADPGPLFINKETQALLKSLARVDVGRIFRKRSVKETTLQFKFMTTEQIQEEVETALKRAEVKLQMPPVMKIREEQTKTLSTDPALKDFDEASYVFTDITFGIPDAERTIVIRDTEGTLSTAPSDIRKRLNQFYFPLNGRQVRVPKLFEPDNLKALLQKDEFEFILDALCIQYEPYEKEFHDISATVYEFIDENKRFDALRSTRHFGPMSFFLAWHARTDNLLLDMIERDYLDNCVDLIELSCKLQKKTPPSADKVSKFRAVSSQKAASGVSTVVENEIREDVGKTGEQLEADAIAMELIKSYVEEHSIKKVQLELAIQTYTERAEGQRKLLRGLQTAHGQGGQ